MFILYAIVIGLPLGLLLGGRVAGLNELRIRWSWLFVAGLAIQVVLFSDAVTQRIGSLGIPIYVLSTGLVAGVVLANWRIVGMPIVALGALSNLVTIVANGGYMPASAEAMAALERVPKTGYSNSALLANPALAPLTDIFALPAWLPWANVFSIGDVFIAIGVIVIIVAAMRKSAPAAVGAH